MAHPLLGVSSIDQASKQFLGAIGELFAVFDERTQDSGNISYGLRIGDERYFIKTAGRPDDTAPYLSHPERVALLRNAVRLSRGCRHPALVPLRQVIESPEGPLLVYDWIDGELLRVRRSSRDDPRSAYQRFRRLPVDEVARVLDDVFELHHGLAEQGWIAVDFYDGSLIYDFARQQLRVVDLDTYHVGPFINQMGRMFGSSRFMAPEEFQLGALIDARTNVFTMGRTMSVFLSDGTFERAPFRGTDALYEVMRHACRGEREERFESIAAFWSAWREAKQAGELHGAWWRSRPPAPGPSPSIGRGARG